MQPNFTKTDDVTFVPVEIEEGAPNLTILGTPTALTSTALGETIFLEYTVTNNGSASVTESTYWYDSFYISDDTTLDDSDTYIGDRYTYSDTPFAPGDSYTATYEAFTGSSVDDKYLLFAVDGYDYQLETDETDNVTAVPIKIGEGGPNLTISGTPTAPTSANLGETISLEYTVTNNGSFTASSSWWDSFYISDDATLDSSDIYIGDRYTDSDTPLAAGNSYTATYDAFINSSVGTGSKYLLFAADRYSYQAETDETDNVTAVPILINADLTSESNDTIKQAICLPNGSGSYLYKGFIGDNPNVAPSDDVDLIKLKLNEGARAIIDINAREYGSALDSVLRVFDSTGNEVAFNDDTFVTSDSYRDSFIDFTASVTDTYYIGVSSYHNFDYNIFEEGSDRGYTTGEYDISILVENNDTGSISGTKWYDKNGDGIRNAVGSSTIINTIDNPGGLDPDQIDVQLVPGDDLTFDITVTVPESSTSLPLDFVLLQDLSGSFSDDIPTVSSLVPSLVSSVLSIQPDTTFGVTSFVDKPISPFGASSDYVYQTDLALTTDTSLFQTTVDDLVTLSGSDTPESQLEALMQVALRETEVGYRPNSRRVVLLTTDAPYHVAGDGISASITTPNNGDDILDGSPAGTGEDYPDIDQVRSALISANIVPIFAVTSSEISTYQNLVDQLGFGVVEELTSDSSNLVDAITSGLDEAFEDIVMVAESDDYGYVESITPNSYFDVPEGESRTFTVTLDTDASPVIPDTITFRALGFGETEVNVGSTALESGLGGVEIYLDLNNNGVLDADEPSTFTATDNPDTLEDETGYYEFTGLSAGEYIVREVVPSGYVQTSPIEGFHQISLAEDENVTDVDFGNRLETVVEDFMGETGTISNLTDTARTINLAQNYVKPVVLAQPLSYNGSAPATVRLDNITSNSFTVSVQEPNNEDGAHAGENLSYMVVEAGTWELADGTILEVGTTDSSQLVTNGWETVNFNADFDNAPVVMSQIQTFNGADFVRTRQDDITENGFLVGMEEEEANQFSGHTNETIGYMAMSGGSGNWSGLNYIAGYTGDNVTDAWETVNFGAGFSETPQILASLASYDGADPAGIRRRSLSNNQVQFKVEEDTSADAEMAHTTENISFLAIEGTGILEAVNIDSLAPMLSESTVLADIQTLDGTESSDTFILGDATEAFYDNMAGLDYALIKGFESSDDVIQLYGNASDYQLGAAPEGLPDGTSIFQKNDGANELIGVVSGVSDLALDSNSFSFV